MAFAAKEPGCACALFWAGIWLGLLCAFGQTRWPVVVSQTGVARVPFCPAFGSAYSALLGQTRWAGRWRVQWAGLQALQRIFFLCRGIKKQPAARFSGACIFLYNHRLAPGLYTDLLFSRLPPAFCKKTKTDPGAKARRSLILRWPIAF